MRSPLAPILANLFLGHHEESCFKHQKANKVIFYERYVDDIFCLFEKEEDFSGFFDLINSHHNTGLLTNYFSFTPLKYKLTLVRTLIDRAFKVNSTWLHFHQNLVKIKSNLQNK